MRPMASPPDARLRGIFTPNIVPLDARGQIDERELRRYVDWLIERGVHGLYPNGSTGEFTRFTVEERQRIIRIVCEQAAGRVPILAGAAEANVNETLAACELYHQYGARAVAIVSPFYYKLSPESVYAYFREIALNSPIDVTLYNIPMFASPIDVPTLLRLAEFDRIIGIKDSSGDVAFMGRMINAVRPRRSDFTFLTGWDVVLIPMMLIGADGGTNATSGVVPELMRRLYDLGAAHRWDEAIPLQLRLVELFDTMLFSADFPEGFRAAAELRGINFGRGRMPMSERQRIDRARLQHSLQCIMSDFGVVDTPAGCPVRDTDPLRGEGEPIDAPDGDDQVRQVTERVMAQLRQKGMA
jgi:dihydrodipicolinate synthase/N-acetylneuraminate lyase